MVVPTTKLARAMNWFTAINPRRAVSQINDCLRSALLIDPTGNLRYPSSKTFLTSSHPSNPPNWTLKLVFFRTSLALTETGNAHSNISIVSVSAAAKRSFHHRLIAHLKASLSNLPPDLKKLAIAYMVEARYEPDSDGALTEDRIETTHIRKSTNTRTEDPPIGYNSRARWGPVLFWMTTMGSLINLSGLTSRIRWRHSRRCQPPTKRLRLSRTQTFGWP